MSKRRFWPRKASKISVGDYVLAAKWPDFLSVELWRVGVVSELKKDGDKVTCFRVGEYPRGFRYAIKLTKIEGMALLGFLLANDPRECFEIRTVLRNIREDMHKEFEAMKAKARLDARE